MGMVLVENDQGMQKGTGKLVGWHDPDENREWIVKNKSRGLEDKRMTVQRRFLDLSRWVVSCDGWVWTCAGLHGDCL